MLLSCSSSDARLLVALRSAALQQQSAPLVPPGTVPSLTHLGLMFLYPPGAGLSVRELTGDMQLSKKELAETQASAG